MPPSRVLSLDAFRGLTIAAVVLVNSPGTWVAVYAPLKHARWHGLTPTDVIFPFFLFIVGVAIPLSQPRPGRVLRRAAVIFALGIVLNGLPGFDWATIRIPGVLQRIAVCYLIAALLFLTTGWRTQAIVTAALLLGYWAAMTLVPVPGYRRRRPGAGRRDRDDAGRRVERVVPREQGAVDQFLRGADGRAGAARVRGVLCGDRDPRVAALRDAVRRARRQRARALLSVHPGGPRADADPGRRRPSPEVDLRARVRTVGRARQRVSRVRGRVRARVVGRDVAALPRGRPRARVIVDQSRPGPTPSRITCRSTAGSPSRRLASRI